MILKDRVIDIYQNYSVCENNCKYEKINLNQSISTCKCLIKINSDNIIIEKPNLETIILDSLTDSNLGVIKCYNLVFYMKNKIKNIGFCIFTFLIIIHIPLYIFCFIVNISSIKKYISFELNKNHYSNNVINPVKKNIKKSKTFKSKNELINNNTYKKDKIIDYRHKNKKDYNINTSMAFFKEKSLKIFDNNKKNQISNLFKINLIF